MSAPQPIAIVSMAGVFPEAPDTDALWDHIVNRRQAFDQVPAHRWPLDPAVMIDPAGKPDKAFHGRCGLIRNFTPDLTGLDPELALGHDPVCHLALHVGRKAAKACNLDPVDPDRVAVILAAIALPTESTSRFSWQVFGPTIARHLIGTTPETGPDPADAMGTGVVGLPAALVAQGLGFGGGSFTIDAACASSLYAIKLACDRLVAGRADAVLAGGVSRPDCLYTQVGFSQLKALSPTGRCLAFDRAADGLMVGEGAAVVVLKRLADALDHGDRILGVIAGIGLSNDIGGGLLAPSSEGQVRAMAQAYRMADWRPDQVDLIECHGAGTPVGDAVEIQSLKTLWQGIEAGTGVCPIGSVKSNIGHLLTAAGAAGLVKILLALDRRTLPPQAGFENPIQPLADSPFAVPTEARHWTRRNPGTPRRAGLSAFGFGGINAHLLIQAHAPAGFSIAVPDLPRIRPVAVVGIGAAFAGAGDSRTLVPALRQDHCLIGPLPDGRWRGLVPHHRVTGAFIDAIQIDGAALRLPPSELPDLLAQQLIMLKVAAEAMADAGIENGSAKPWMGAVVAIDFDFETTDFHLRWLAGHLAEQKGMDPHRRHEIEQACSPALTATRVLGALGSIVVSRLARQFRLAGPCFTLSDGPAGGMQALESGVRMIQQGQARSVLVGAVAMAGDLRTVLARTLARGQNGYAAGNPGPAGEGATALVLKDLDEAIRDKDRIYGQIIGIGAAGGQTACSRSMRAALDEAGIGIDAVGFTAVSQDRQAGADLPGASAQNVQDVLGHCGAAASLAAVLATLARIGGDRGKKALAAARHPDGTTIHVVLEGGPHAWVPRSGDQPAVRPYRRVVGSPLVAQPLGFSDTLAPNPVHVADHDPATDAGLAMAEGKGLMASAIAASQATAAAHEAFLDLSADLTRQYADTLVRRLALLDTTARPAPPIGKRSGTGHRTTSPPAVQPGRDAQAKHDQIIYNRSDCIEFAIGSAAKVLGPEFADVDTYPVRVRLPDEPLMLVDRIMAISGTKASLGPGTIVTEHDVVQGAWYLDGDRAPVCIAVEAGQADLFLSAYLGIDKVVKGQRAYRLLDATVRFHRGLPRPGETIRYAIAIDKFVRQGDTHMFFFNFTGTIDGQPLITMHGGCAGFFTADEVKNSGGIILTDQDRRPAAGKLTGDFAFLLPPQPARRLDGAAIAALARGDLQCCFGEAFTGLTLAQSLRLPRGRMGLIHRVLELDPQGGRFGLGRIHGQADIHPDDWFLTCHFVDDRVMPGTLMYQCCEHTLRIFLLSLGWIGEGPGLCFEPVAGVESRLKCRGPVTPDTTEVVYDVQVKELGYGPEPYAVADAHMYADGRHIVFFENLSLKITGLTRRQIEQQWLSRIGPAPAGIASRPPVPPPVFSRSQVLAFATGLPSEAFGDTYRPFDRDRFIARLPAPPYSFLDRIQTAQPKAWHLAPDGWIEALYPVPSDAWYFRADRSGAMPFCVLQEAALQACGWLAAYVGSALKTQKEVYFRNLGGKATLHGRVLPGSADLITRCRLTKVAEAGDMIIEHYEFKTTCEGDSLYEGLTNFGFFTAQALARQKGLSDAAENGSPLPLDRWATPARVLETARPLTPEDPFCDVTSGVVMPARALAMIDTIDVFLPCGGPHGQGYGLATKSIDPKEWFFKAHFFQDPVCPGSLGLESFLQLLRFIAIQRWPEACAGSRIQSLTGRAHEWAYRGQILPTNARITVEAVITKAGDAPRPYLLADGRLGVDGMWIYRMKDFGVELIS